VTHASTWWPRFASVCKRPLERAARHDGVDRADRCVHVGAGRATDGAEALALPGGVCAGVRGNDEVELNGSESARTRANGRASRWRRPSPMPRSGPSSRRSRRASRARSGRGGESTCRPCRACRGCRDRPPTLGALARARSAAPHPAPSRAGSHRSRPRAQRSR
jgi:hypothetical protein